MRTIKAIIFDFDGTILDTETPEYEAWQTLCAEYNVDLPLELWATGVGVGAEANPFNPYRYLAEQAGEEIDIEAVRARRRALFLDLLTLQKPRPGILDYLAVAESRGIQIGLASSSAHDWVDGHLSRLGLLDRFPVRWCADDVTHTKPNPELYQRCLAALGRAPEEAIAIEDSPNGIRAAKAADLYCLGYPNSLTRLLSGLHLADRLVDSLADLPLPTLLTEIEVV